MPDQNIDQLQVLDLYNCLPKIHHVERRHLCVLPTSQPDIISNLDHSLDLLCVFALRIMQSPLPPLYHKTDENQCDHSLNDQDAEQMCSLRTEKIPNPE